VSFKPGDLIFTEEAVVLMDLVKTTSWKNLYEQAAARCRKDGRGLVAIEDVLAVMDKAFAQAIDETRKTAEVFAAEG
jgi:hypothetical protein